MMESLIHNDYRQHPISSDEGLAGYRSYLALVETMIAEQEDAVGQARTVGDEHQLASTRTRLWRLLTKRQGVVDAIAAYERQRADTNTVSQATAGAGTDAAAGQETASTIPRE